VDVQATQLRTGMLVKFDGKLFSIFRTEHRTPGNKRGFVQAKMRNLDSGALIDHKFSSEDFVEKVSLDDQEMEYLYEDGAFYYFMNTETYEQIHLSKDDLGDQVLYLLPNSRLKVQFYEGKPFNVDLPGSIDLTVVETEPGIKSATVTSVTKPAKLETGLVVQVPPFIKEGEKIRVNTADGSYQSRA
jgi:elongation factor P